jgi:hypothetical protein
MTEATRAVVSPEQPAVPQVQERTRALVVVQAPEQVQVSAVAVLLALAVELALEWVPVLLALQEPGRVPQVRVAVYLDSVPR